jgi:hypothetical protein
MEGNPYIPAPNSTIASPSFSKISHEINVKVIESYFPLIGMDLAIDLIKASICCHIFRISWD